MPTTLHIHQGDFISFLRDFISEKKNKTLKCKRKKYT